jgi:phosphoribosylglycinamide formyltransferase 1
LKKTDQYIGISEIYPNQKRKEIMTIRIGVLVSGSGSNLQAIMDACERGTVNGNVVVVGADNETAYGLVRAQRRGIPTFLLDYREIKRDWRAGKFTTPADYDHQDTVRKVGPDFFSKMGAEYFATKAAVENILLSQLNEFQLDLLCLAGFMQIMTPYFIDRFNINPNQPRIMNIHPALLPAFPGTDGYGDTYRYGCKVGGCTVHFVDYGEDTGPIIGQKSYVIESYDTIYAIKEKGLKLEWSLYPECIQFFAEHRLLVVKNEAGRKEVRIAEIHNTPTCI